MSNVVFFDGVDDNVVCGVIGTLPLRLTTEWTISIRFKLMQLYQFQKYVLQRGNFYAIILGYLTPRNIVEFFSIGYAGDDLRPGSSITIPDVGWHMVTYAYSNAGTSWKGFLDGQRIFSLVKTTTLNNAAEVFRLGGSGAIATNELIAEVQIYNRQLSDIEVLYNYSHPGNPIKRGIQLNLTQDSIQGATWLDLSGNAINGTYYSGTVPVVANLLCGR